MKNKHELKNRACAKRVYEKSGYVVRFSAAFYPQPITFSGAIKQSKLFND